MKDLNRRRFLGLAAGVGAAAILPCGCSSNASTTTAISKRPNIIFLLTDDQRADTIGSQRVRTNQ